MSHTSSSETLETSFDHAQKAELCLAMGSSLTVTPAAEVPQVRPLLFGGQLLEFCLPLRLPVTEFSSIEPRTTRTVH